MHRWEYYVSHLNQNKLPGKRYESTNPSKTETHEISYNLHEEAEGHNAKEEAAQNDVVAVEGPLDGKHQAVIRSRQEQAPM